MSEVERTAPPWSRLAYLLALVPAVALGVQGVVTARTLNLFEQGTVVAGAAAFLHGDMLYSDHFAFYGPLAYLVPYAGIPLFGVARGIFVVDFVVAAIMCLLVYALARRISGRPWLALLAPVILALAGGATQRNMMALASVLALVELERSGAVRWAVAAGASAALALLWFQDTGVWVAVATGLAAVLIRIFGEPERGVSVGLDPAVVRGLGRRAGAVVRLPGDPGCPARLGLLLLRLPELRLHRPVGDRLPPVVDRQLAGAVPPLAPVQVHVLPRSRTSASV